MKKLMYTVLAASALVACNNEETLDMQSPYAIDFAGPSIENATRAGVAEDPSLTVNNIQGFDVWAFMDEPKGKVLVGEDVTKNGDEWTYLHTQYWLPNHTFYFGALAPMNSANWSLNTENANTLGVGTVTFENKNGSEDLIYAATSVTTEADINKVPGKVGLTFNHLLSKLKFSFKNGFPNENTRLVVRGITMQVPSKGSINLAVENWWDNIDDWTLATNAAPLTLEFGNVGELSNTNAQCNVERFTIPTDGNYTYNITFTVDLYMGELPAHTFNETSVVTGVALEMGKAYNFNATLDASNLGISPILFNVDEIEEWDENNGVELKDFKYDGVNYTANSAKGLQQIAEGINDGSIETDCSIVLDGNIDLASTRSFASNWTPIGSSEKPFTGTFDGNGYTIKNLALIETEAKEGKAYIGFFGYAQDATIKNVNFENVYINIPCLDIDHSQGHIGAVAGSLEGTSTIENVTMKGDITVYATQTANGASRVAVVAGGNSYGNVTMKNVHVIANEGSSLIANNNVGALAGQLQGKMVFENCTSNINVTANKFFAGGLVGIAAGDSKFVNCHTTGDVAVVAGRENRHNDEYRVGGIAGGWADGKTKVCTLENCSYTGKVSGMNADGTVATPLDYLGYVGRGYTLSNCAGSKVIIDGFEFVQVGDAAPYGNYEVKTPAGKTVIMISTAEELNNLKATDAYVMLNADIDFEGAAMNKPIELWKNSTFDGAGHKISNVVTAVQGGYATSLFRGDANPGDKVVKNLFIENLATPAGYSYASAIWSDLQGANIEINNVHINNATIAANGTIGGFVGFVSGSTTSVVIKNSSINNSNLNGGEAEHKRGAVVGRAYGCAVTCENVEVSNVKINDVAADASTLVGGEKGYTGTVTVK
ncbi:MAG: fimbrillin family protein [Bacteroidaceae bacterium]|nr:fimbrillin family protein [Bacteroidaceae bacterium]